MTDNKITASILYVGADDKTLDLFESQYIIPNGISYNSYVILDKKIAVMDTADKRVTDVWFENVEKALDGKTPDFLVVLHLEPDHAANIQKFCEKYPNATVVLSAKAEAMLPQFFTMDFTGKTMAVKEGDTLSLGAHTLTFIMAPMIHWPEVMVAYESTEKVLFSADAFGKFGALDADEDWACEARRYYFNIVGKYGAQVQTLLKKAAALDIQKILPLHGPILEENLGYYIDKYNTWSSYTPEDEGVLVACASIHGNTKEAALKMVEILKAKGAKKVAFTDLTRDDMAEAIEDAFRYEKLVLMASSYDGGVFPCMEDFLRHLKAKNFQNRKAAIVENGSWAPSAGRIMKELVESMKNVELCPTMVTMKSTMKEDTILALEGLADEILA